MCPDATHGFRLHDQEFLDASSPATHVEIRVSVSQSVSGYAAKIYLTSATIHLIL